MVFTLPPTPRVQVAVFVLSCSLRFMSSNMVTELRHFVEASSLVSHAVECMRTSSCKHFAPYLIAPLGLAVRTWLLCLSIAVQFPQPKSNQERSDLRSKCDLTFNGFEDMQDTL